MSYDKNIKVNVDLAKERLKCNFNITEVTHILDGGEQNTVQRKKIGKVIHNRFNYLTSFIRLTISLKVRI